MISEERIEMVIDLVTLWGLRVVGAIVVLIIGRFVAGLVRKAVRRGLEKREADATLVPFVSSLVYYLALAFVLIAVLSLFGVQTASLVAVLGAAGLAIGLALQGTLSHFASGIMLLIFRPFRVGDYVAVGDTKGTVEELGIFATTLRSPDNIKITVPNSAIYGSSIHNYDGYDTRRVDILIGISYGDDIEAAREIIHRVVESDERVLADPPLQTVVAELADSSVNLSVRPWARSSDYWQLKFELTERIKRELEENGVTIPFPQRDVHLYQQTGTA